MMIYSFEGGRVPRASLTGIVSGLLCWQIYLQAYVTYYSICILTWTNCKNDVEGLSNYTAILLCMVDGFARTKKKLGRHALGSDANHAKYFSVSRISNSWIR